MRRCIQPLLLCVLALAGCAHGQFIGEVSQQSVVSTPFNNVTCTSALATGRVSITNIGQGAHFASANSGGLTTSLNYTIQGSYDGSTFFDISDVGTSPVNGSDINQITGSGYYPVVAVNVSACAPASATVTIKYSGISMTPGAPVGAAQAGQINKHLVAGGAANTTFTTGTIRAPFGSSSGTLTFLYTSASGPSGSTLQVNCNSNILGSGPVLFGPVTLQTTNGLFQVFNVGQFACPFFTVSYTTGGASTAIYTLDYTFAPPGVGPPAFQFTHITGTTATAVKGTLGFLHTLSVNTGGAGTISIFDLASASCTGTPSTNTVAVITATASTLETFIYDVNLLNGICVKASVAMDVTVSSQ
jgi:hypothetical protein